MGTRLDWLVELFLGERMELMVENKKGASCVRLDCGFLGYSNSSSVSSVVPEYANPFSTLASKTSTSGVSYISVIINNI